MPARDFEQRRPRIAEDAYIDPLALVIGEVEMESGASLWPMAVARGDIQRIHIGPRSNIQDGAVLHVTHAGRYCEQGRGLYLDEAVTVGHRAVLHACRVEHHCLIGIGAIVLDDAHLPPHTLVAAGSLVPPGRELEGGYLWRGSPAQKARPLTEDEIAYFEYTAAYYVELARRHAKANVK